MGLNKDRYDSELLGNLKKRAATVKAGKATNPKNQQGLTADRRKTGLVRAASRK